MKFRYVLLIIAVLLAGCEATAVKNVSLIRTKAKLDENIILPIQVPVAFYVERGKPDNGINFYGKLEQAAKLVVGDMFLSAEKLTNNSDFYYFLQLNAASTWDQVWGGWKSTLTMEVISRQGEKLYSSTTSKTASGGGYYDYNAVHNSLASALKEGLIRFLGDQGQQKIADAVARYQKKDTEVAGLKVLIKDLPPQSSGTGFFINGKGVVATASHVVNDCLFVEVNHKGETVAGEIINSSDILDLAVISTEYQNDQHVMISKHDTLTQLGKQVFVTGFPLAGLLADYPSLTVGNISSMGGLKGASGHFQFSAPVQPGNSGGAIADYQGNLIGVVSSSLNQKMLLKQAGTTAQNVNFGIDLHLFKKFLDKSGVSYTTQEGRADFEQASKDAVEYTNQILCYK